MNSAVSRSAEPEPAPGASEAAPRPEPEPRARPDAAPRRQWAALHALFDVGRALASTLDFQALLRQIMTLSMETIGSETASVMLASPETGELVLACAHGLPEGAQPGVASKGGSGVAEWVYRQGKPVLLHGSPSDDPRFHVSGSREHIHSALSVPLVGKRGPVGVLSLNNSSRRKRFSEDDLELLSAIGTQAGIAVENARLHEQIAETNRQLTVTVEQLRSLTSSLVSMTAPSLDASLQTMLDAAVEGTGARAGSLSVLDESDSSYQIEAVSHDSAPLPPPVSGRWREAAEAVAASHEEIDRAAGLPDHTLIRVLTAEGRPIGLLKLIAPLAGAGFSAEDREFVDALVEHASVIVYNGMLYQQAEAGRLALQRAYTDLREKQEQLIHSEKLAAIGQLAAKVCHEINNPLTSISGCTQLMQRKLASEGAPLDHGGAYRRYLETIAAETERCSRITGELLQFARKRPPAFSPFDLHDVLNQTMSLLEFRYEARHRFEGDFDFAIPRLHGDAQQITQVMLNLLTNAAEAMPEGGRISVTTRWSGVTDPECAYALVYIRDEGPGLSGDGASSPFEPFYTTKATGTGLGLTICREILSVHRGSIRLENAPEGGAVATVVLPLDAATAPLVVEEAPLLQMLPRSDTADALLAAGGAPARDGRGDGGIR